MRRRWRWLMWGGALALLSAAAAGVLLLRSEWFREQVRLKLIEVAESATGGRVELQRFHYDWSAMRARVEGFTLHGRETAGQAPLLRIPELELAIHVRSLLRRDIELRSLLIKQPAVHIYVAADGSTNLPAPKRTGEAPNVVEELLRLRIGRIEISEGLAHYDSRSIPLELRAEGVKAVLTLAGSEAIGFELDIAETTAWDRKFALASRGRMEPQRVEIEQARLTRLDSSAMLSASVEDFHAPRIAGRLRADVALREWPELGLDGGRARVESEFSWNETESLRAGGTVEGDGLRADFEDFTIANARLRTVFAWRPGDLRLMKMRITALGGEWAGEVRLREDSELELTGEARGLSAGAIAAAARIAEFPWDAGLSGSVQVRAQVTEQGLADTVARVEVRVEPVEGHLAVEGQVAGEWRQKESRLILDASYLATRSSRLTVAGVAGENMTAGLFSTNPQDLEPALALLAGRPVELPIRLQGGSLQVRAQVSGPLQEPEISGEVAATQMLWRDFSMQRASADFRLAAGGLELKRLRLEQNGSRVEGRLRLGLKDWELPAGAAVEAALEAKGLRLSDAARLAGFGWTAEGTVDASLEAAGTLDAPRGTLRWQGRQVKIGDEQFAKLNGRLRARSAESLQVDGELELDSAAASLAGSYAHPAGDWQSGEATLRMRLRGFRLAHSEFVQQLQEGLDAGVTLEAAAQVRVVKGELALRRLDGFLALDEVRDRKRPLGALRVDARTEGTALQLTWSGRVEETPLAGQTRVRLQPRYPAEGTWQLENLPMAAVARWLDKEQWQPRGALTAQMRWRGELADLGKATAVLTIPNFVLTPQDAGGNSAADEFTFRNAGPVQVDIDANGVQVRSARFAAKESSLTVAGLYLFGSRTPWDLSMNGSVNLALLSSFEPDLLAAGVAQVSANLRGAADSPTVNGRMTIRDGSLFLRGLNNGLEDVNGLIYFDRDRANIESLTATTGGGSLALRGFVGFGSGELSYRLQAEAKGVRVRYPEGVSTTVDSSLSLTGSSNASLLAGLVTVQRSGFSSRGDFASLVAGSTNPVPVPATQNEFLRNLQFDIRVRTAPNASFQTDYTQDLQTEADLRVRGSLAKPVVLGSVNVNQGEINFFGNRYTISRGEILFYNTATIQPSINLDLETRIRGVVVYIGVSGPLARLNVNYRSEPPLQSREILALLTVGRAPAATATGLQQQGLNPSAQQTGAGTNMLAEASNTLLGGALSASVSSRVEKFFGVSRIKIDPNVTGVENIPQARLTIEQSLSRDITLTFSSNLSRSSQQIIRLEWDLSKQWSAIAVRDENGAFGVDFLYRKRFK